VQSQFLDEPEIKAETFDILKEIGFNEKDLGFLKSSFDQDREEMLATKQMRDEKLGELYDREKDKDLKTQLTRVIEFLNMEFAAAHSGLNFDSVLKEDGERCLGVLEERFGDHPRDTPRKFKVFFNVMRAMLLVKNSPQEASLNSYRDSIPKIPEPSKRDFRRKSRERERERNSMSELVDYRKYLPKKQKEEGVAKVHLKEAGKPKSNWSPGREKEEGQSGRPIHMKYDSAGEPLYIDEVGSSAAFSISQISKVFCFLTLFSCVLYYYCSVKTSSSFDETLLEEI